MHPNQYTHVRLCLVFVLLLSACADDTVDPGSGDDTSDEFVPELVHEDSLLAGAPDNSALPEEGKFDASYPVRFDLVDSQSPIRNQASRGTCSIFSTVGLMEHLYILEGTIENPDFSEQFLQWSVKTEIEAFTETEGSSPRSNLDAIHRFGIVTEEVLPYERSRWGTSNDERCTGDDRPTLCHTNGTPPESALTAQRWNLPRGRFIRSSVGSIKAYMTEHETAVTATMRFYYQSWNHGRSPLTTSSAYSRAGYVLYPTVEDQEHGDEKRAGHSILIVGWDDEVSVPIVDAEGNQVLDDNGEPTIETGFFLFKNSWGTGRFGADNPHGVGYGWLSYRYVEEYGSIYSASVPTLALEEICDDGVDNDFNDASDCDDSACSNEPTCNPNLFVVTSDERMDIPDNNEDGVRSELVIEQAGTVSFVRVSVDIEHSYSGDLTVSLIAPNGGTAVLQSKRGGGQDDIVQTYEPTELNGAGLAGTWTLLVVDSARADVGAIRGWTLEVVNSGEVVPEVCGDGVDNDANGQLDCADATCAADPSCAESTTVTVSDNDAQAIPDNTSNGASSLVEVSDEGLIEAITVNLDITHTYRGDLTVTLSHEDGTEVRLHDREGGSADNLVRSYAPEEFLGHGAAGLWALDVVDHAGGDSGTLNSWGLELVLR